MNIQVNFINGTDYWQQKVLQSAADASTILSDPLFIAKVRSWPGFDYCDKTPDQIADHLQSLTSVAIQVGFYRGWFWSKAIAYEEDGCVYFNTRKEAYGAGSQGNVAHEVMHAIGYQHNGNAAAGNEDTVPYRIGEWVDSWVVQPAPQPAKIAVESVTA